MYHKITGPLKARFWARTPACTCPTIGRSCLTRKPRSRSWSASEKPGVPAYLSGPEWDRASRGLLAVAINNQDGAFAKAYDLGRPDDAVVLSLFKGVDRWVFGVDDADAIALHAVAACSPDASVTIATHGRIPGEAGPGSPRDIRVPRARSRVARTAAFRWSRCSWRTSASASGNGSVELHTEGFGTLAEFGALIEADFDAACDAEPGQESSSEVTRAASAIVDHPPDPKRSAGGCI